MHFAPWGSDDDGYAAYPTLNRSDRDVDSVMARTKYARTWELSKEFKAGTEYPMDYIRKVDDYLRGGQFHYTERPPRTPVDDAPLDYFINVSKLGYCQHFAGRDGADAADGRHPGAGRHGLHPRRLLDPPQGLDRARHRRPRLGRGLVRRVRLDRDRPHAARHARPLAGRQPRRRPAPARR